MEGLQIFAHGAILCPNWTYLYTVSLWEIHANFHIIAVHSKNEAVKPIKSIHIWKANTITIPNMDMSVSVYRVGKKHIGCDIKNTEICRFLY